MWCENFTLLMGYGSPKILTPELSFFVFLYSKEIPEKYGFQFPFHYLFSKQAVKILNSISPPFFLLGAILEIVFLLIVAIWQWSLDSSLI